MLKNVLNVSAVCILVCLSLVGCGSRPSISIGPYAKAGPITISATVNNYGEITLSGTFNQTFVGTEELGVGWEIGFEDTISFAKQKQYALFVLYENNQGVLFRSEYDINLPFRIVFTNQQWVQRIQNDGNGNIIVYVQVQEAVSPQQGQSDPGGSGVNSNTPSAMIACSDSVRQVNLRSTPGYLNKDASDVVYMIDCGQNVQLLGDNQSADGLTWWHVTWNGYTGWIADHTGNGHTILVFNP